MENIKSKEHLFNSSKAESWFEDLMNNIQLDQTLLKTGLASKEKKDFYSCLIEGNTAELIKQHRELNNQYFISNIIIDYIQLLHKDNIKPKKLGFDYSNSRVLVWAEVDNEQTEDGLILAQAEINAKYQDFGIHLSSSIVETEDKLSVPAHYRALTN